MTEDHTPGPLPGIVKTRTQGYEAARAPVNFGAPLDITLLADPGTTFEQLGDWEANLRFEKSWEWAHPDTHVYLTKAQFLRAWRDDLQQGYQLQRVDVKSYKILRAWTHTNCEVADFGPKKYKRVAAVQARTVYSAPEGGIERQEGISHWVQTKDGRWRWFPQANCRYLV